MQSIPSKKQCLYFSFIKLLYKKSINSLDFACCAKLIIMQQLFFTWIGLCFYRTYILPSISSLFKQYFRKSFCCGYNLPNLLVKCILAKTKLCKFGFLAKKDVRKSQIAWQAFLFYQSRSYCLQSFQTNYRTVYPFTFFVPSLHNLKCVLFLFSLYRLREKLFATADLLFITKSCSLFVVSEEVNTLFVALN